MVISCSLSCGIIILGGVTQKGFLCHYLVDLSQKKVSVPEETWKMRNLPLT
jgi:hypothetical protein